MSRQKNNAPAPLDEKKDGEVPDVHDIGNQPPAANENIPEIKNESPELPEPPAVTEPQNTQEPPVVPEPKQSPLDENSLPKYSKEQLLKSATYSHRRDVLRVLLADEGLYTHADVAALIKEFFEKRVE